MIELSSETGATKDFFMSDDERTIFSFGFGFFLLSLLAIAAFHAAFYADEKKLDAANKKIVALEQDLANASARFSGLVQPERLRPIVIQIFPHYRPIGTGRAVAVKDMK